MSRSHRRRSMLIAALVALGSFGMTSHAQPAIASTLTVDLLYCEGIGGGTSTVANFFCDAYVSGGSGGNTYTWNIASTWRSDSPSGSSISGKCSVGKTALVRFTVTDSSGATASAQTSFYCYRIAP